LPQITPFPPLFTSFPQLINNPPRYIARPANAECGSQSYRYCHSERNAVQSKNLVTATATFVLQYRLLIPQPDPSTSFHYATTCRQSRGRMTLVGHSRLSVPQAGTFIATLPPRLSSSSASEGSSRCTPPPQHKACRAIKKWRLQNCNRHINSNKFN
jgi:hypothetical protein